MQTTILQVEGINSNSLLEEVSKLLDAKLSKLAPAPPPENTTYITRQQVAEMFTITLPTVHAWINVGILKPYKIGNKTRFLLNEVKAAATHTSRKKGGSND